MRRTRVVQAAVLGMWVIFLTARGFAIHAQTAPERGVPPDLEDAILWKDAGRSEALFIPESILATVPLSALPISVADREAFSQWIRALDAKVDLSAPGGSVPNGKPAVPGGRACYVESGSGKEPGPQAVSLERYLQEHANLVVVGRVVAVVPGMNFGYRHVSSMVELDVEEVLKGDGQWPRVGERVFYEQPHGSIVSYGQVLCTESAGRESFRASTGERVLVSGIAPWGDPRLLWGTFAWPVTASGTVSAQPYGAVRQTSPLPLAAIRDAVRKGVAQ